MYTKDPAPLPYLAHADPFNFDIHLSAAIKRASTFNPSTPLT